MGGDTNNSLWNSIGHYFEDVLESEFTGIERVDEERSPDFKGDGFWLEAKLNSVELQDFVDTKFDALISYYKNDNLELNTITALSKANFKIGISGKDVRLNDFIINIKPNKINIFKKEFLKYLKTLNKI